MVATGAAAMVATPRTKNVMNGNGNLSSLSGAMVFCHRADSSAETESDGLKEWLRDHGSASLRNHGRTAQGDHGSEINGNGGALTACNGAMEVNGNGGALTACNGAMEINGNDGLTACNGATDIKGNGALTACNGATESNGNGGALTACNGATQINGNGALTACNGATRTADDNRGHGNGLAANGCKLNGDSVGKGAGVVGSYGKESGSGSPEGRKMAGYRRASKGSSMGNGSVKVCSVNGSANGSGNGSVKGLVKCCDGETERVVVATTEMNGHGFSGNKGSILTEKTSRTTMATTSDLATKKTAMEAQRDKAVFTTSADQIGDMALRTVSTDNKRGSCCESVLDGPVMKNDESPLQNGHGLVAELLSSPTTPCNGRLSENTSCNGVGLRKQSRESCHGDADIDPADDLDRIRRKTTRTKKKKNRRLLCCLCASKVKAVPPITVKHQRKDSHRRLSPHNDNDATQTATLLDDPCTEGLHALLDDLKDLERNAIDLANQYAATIQEMDVQYKSSAKNLIHYFSVRNTDIRKVQDRLVSRGFSSLGHLEAHVLAHIRGVMQILSGVIAYGGTGVHQMSSAHSEQGDGQSPAMKPFCKSFSTLPSSSPSLLQSPPASPLPSPLPPQVSSPLQPIHTVAPVHSSRHGRWGVCINMGHEQLELNTQRLLGPREKHRSARIMVTLPREAQDDTELITDLLKSGMNVARVNCAYDDDTVWKKIADNVREKSRELKKSCKILMDLGGAKLRTGPLSPGPRVVSFGPKEDALGKKIAPATIWLAPPKVSVPRGKPCDACVPVLPEDFPSMLQIGDVLEVQDARGKIRILTVVEVDRDGNVDGARSARTGGCFLQCQRRTILESGSEIRLLAREGDDGIASSNLLSTSSALTSCGGDQRCVGDKGQTQESDLGHRRRVLQTAIVQQLKTADNPIVVMKGDILILTRDLSPGFPEVRCAVTKELKRPGQIACPVEEVFDCAERGHPILLDDGRIKGIIEEIDHDRIVVKIENADAKGTKLRADKGINLPKTKLKLKGLVEKDVRDLDFIADNADMVGFSFANDAEDVAALQRELYRRSGSKKGIVLKIETNRGFDNLPWMLLTAMRTANPFGVMIARGDLAAECGWERMAEIQEEILWACEAAHVPVIWATQVLDRLAKTGTPTRAEITDAAMGERAECVMLNKGPTIVEATRSLDDILRRMHDHQRKKQPRLRTLALATKFLEAAPKT
ncbi:hypothetical protein CBR_g44458 [Chara braunii]|uniref:pyruvate kinase n=1 Tax=Chara braunii TaxID=69332 RepID=A0A388LXF6_CHABU|nr:hypothetical protein CBR_g44458 [Chara braunii]|eukprot:GBG87004.1 hypothetical protein CBR_g44458 [Chara braunii]